MPKKIISTVLAVIMLLSVFGLAGCTVKASKYTEAQHIQRITERVRAKYIDGDGILYSRAKPTDFMVYPLYNENDELIFFLVEFEPYGFLYIYLVLERPFYVYLLGPHKNMYAVSTTASEAPWSRYTVKPTSSLPIPEDEKIWELDEYGRRIFYDRSPYFVAGAMESRKYILETKANGSTYCILAIKTGDKYLNLISMEEFEYANGKPAKLQACQYISCHSGI